MDPNISLVTLQVKSAQHIHEGRKNGTACVYSPPMISRATRTIERGENGVQAVSKTDGWGILERVEYISDLHPFMGRDALQNDSR